MLLYIYVECCTSIYIYVYIHLHSICIHVNRQLSKYWTPRSIFFPMIFYIPPNQGAGDLLGRIASAKRTEHNVARNLRRVIQKAGASLPVEIYLVETTIQVTKPRLRVLPVYWPCLSMRSWIDVLLNQFPQFVLGGFKLQEMPKWRALFSWFWNVYREYDGDHEIYKQNGELGDLSLAIPIATHGDEGRGARSSSFMVQSFQFVLSFKGPGTTNCSGYFGWTCSFILSNRQLPQRFFNWI